MSSPSLASCPRRPQPIAVSYVPTWACAASAGALGAASRCRGRCRAPDPPCAVAARAWAMHGSARIGRATAAGFRCDARRCVQTLPRMPDDSVGLCGDERQSCSAAVAPTRRVSPSGRSISAGCAGRARVSVRGARGVDLDPDRPSASREWKCSFSTFRASRSASVCPPAPLIGSACGRRALSSRWLRRRPLPAGATRSRLLVRPGLRRRSQLPRG